MDDYDESPEPYEDDLEEFERNQVAMDISLGECPDVEEDEGYDGEDQTIAETEET